MPRLIDANAAIKEMNEVDIHFWDDAEDGVEKCVNILHNAPTVDAIPVKDLERNLSTTPGLELWDYQKRGIMSAVNRLCGKEKNDG